MMVLSESSRILRWAYFPEHALEKKKPRTTSLCAVFWRCVLGTPMFCVFAAILLVAVSPVFAVVWAFEKTHGKQRAAMLLERAKDSRLVEVAGAVKGRVCPMIYVEREEPVRIGSR